MLASSGTLTEVFQRAARYSSLVNEGVIQNFIDGRMIGIRTHFTGVSRYRDRHQVEFWTATMLRLLREFTGSPRDSAAREFRAPGAMRASAK